MKTVIIVAEKIDKSDAAVNREAENTAVVFLADTAAPGDIFTKIDRAEKIVVLWDGESGFAAEILCYCRSRGKKYTLREPLLGWSSKIDA